MKNRMQTKACADLRRFGRQHTLKFRAAALHVHDRTKKSRFVWGWRIASLLASASDGGYMGPKYSGPAYRARILPLLAKIVGKRDTRPTRSAVVLLGHTENVRT